MIAVEKVDLTSLRMLLGAGADTTLRDKVSYQCRCCFTMGYNKDTLVSAPFALRFPTLNLAKIQMSWFGVNYFEL